MSFDDREPTPLQRYALSAGSVRPEMLAWLLSNAARLDGRGVDELEAPFAEALPRRACPGWGCRGCDRPGCDHV